MYYWDEAEDIKLKNAVQAHNGRISRNALLVPGRTKRAVAPLSSVCEKRQTPIHASKLSLWSLLLAAAEMCVYRRVVPDVRSRIQVQ
jgi:hypothetical protein